MVNEYARQPGGWMMQVAFLCMAVSCWALAALTSSLLRPLGPALLAVCGVGFAGAGAFVTDPILLTDRMQTRSGTLHVLFALIVILLFPVMATIVDTGLAARTAGNPFHSWLTVLSVLTWAGLLGFMASTFYSGRRPATSVGYFQRIMILAYAVWLVAIAVGFAHR